MKKNYLFLTTLFLLLFNAFASAQNLVSNCSFEQFDTCPDNEAQIQRSVGWFHTYGDADYYNVCSATPWTVPPQINYQLAATGSAFAGAVLFGENVGGVEVIHTVLTSPLAIGITYYVSFKVNLCYNPAAFMNEAIDKIGAKFTTGHAPFITNSAHVCSNTVISDTANWTTISGSFVADSAYTHLYLGIFFDTAHVNSIILAPSPIKRAYYFIDDVCVSDNASQTCSIVGVEEINGEKEFLLYPNPAKTELRIKNSELKIEEVKIYDTMGEVVFSMTVPSFSFKRRSLEDEAINISSLPPGIYFVTVTDDKKNRISKRFVKM